MDKFIQENAKIIRSILGYNQTNMASLLGITRQHLGNIESGKSTMDQTFTIVFIAVIKYVGESLDKDSVKYKLIKVYLDEFDDYMRKLIYLKGVELI